MASAPQPKEQAACTRELLLVTTGHEANCQWPPSPGPGRQLVLPLVAAMMSRFEDNMVSGTLVLAGESQQRLGTVLVWFRPAGRGDGVDGPPVRAASACFTSEDRDP